LYGEKGTNFFTFNPTFAYLFSQLLKEGDTLSHVEYSHIGNFIRLHRKQQGITQEKLCEGICSITYLSKVENGKMLPSDEIVDLLGKRLGVHIANGTEQEQALEQIQEIFEQIYKEHERNNSDNVEQLYESLLPYSDFLQHPTIYAEYQLISLVHAVHTLNVEQSEPLVQNLSNIIEDLPKMQQLNFYHLKSIYFSLKKQYYDSLISLTKAEALTEELQLTKPFLLYHLALAHSHSKNKHSAIYYANEALKIYNENANYLQSIYCQMILAINYTRTKNYQKALTKYDHLLELADSLQLHTTKASIIHNLAYLHAKMNNIEKAISLYQECLTRHKTPEALLRTLYELAKLLYETNQLQEASHYIDEALKLRPTHDYTDHILITCLKYQMEDTSIEKKQLITHIEEVVIPFFQRQNNIYHLVEHYNLLGELYYSNRKYKIASDYYRLAIHIKKKGDESI
jgi:HTH-type transcriptional regulator, quorum sensing regulator NprR